MDYLNEDEIRRAKMCVSNIKDKLQAVASELTLVEKPHKKYLKEKLDSITWDVNVLNNMVNESEE